MAKAQKVRLPFAWLGRYWTLAGLTLLTVIAAFFRFYQLTSLPPGLDETSARIGLQASHLNASNWLPPLDSTNGYAPLWVWLQAISVQLFGHSALALRIWPALLGVLAVLATWFWMRSWFGKQTAWIAALLVAISPWAVTIARNGIESALLPLLVPLTLWVGTRALRQPSIQQYTVLGAVLALDLLSGPIGVIMAAGVIAFGVWRCAKDRKLFSLPKQKAAGVGFIVAAIALLGYMVGTSLSAIKAMPQALNVVESFGALGQNFIKVLLMFNVRGDENYRHNLAGEPLLNAFVGIMMIAGLLVSISRLHQRLYQVLLALVGVLLLPAILSATNAPNSSWAVGALPLIFALAGIGTFYMLELWYKTFPINSAARTTGQVAIILLLVLSGLQAYTQYFRAWAGMAAVHAVYNEGAVQIAARLATDKPSNERYAVLPADQIPVVEYLAYDHRANYRAVTASKLESLPVANTKRSFYIAAASRDDAVKVLKLKFPGGVLRPQYSKFNQAEIYYTYEVSK